MNKLSVEDIQLLIDLVQEQPVLYDKSYRNYKRNDLKEKIWMEIGKKLNSNEKVCKTAWRSLRDQFIRRRKEFEGKTGQAPYEKKKIYKNFERLSFLSESLEARAHSLSESMTDYEQSMADSECTMANYQEPIELIECGGYSESEFKFKPVPSQSFQTVTLSELSPSSTISASATSTSKNKREDDATEYFKEFLNTLSTQVVTKEPDGVDMFFSSVAETVKGYNLNRSSLALLQRDVLVFVTEKLENFRKGIPPSL